MRHPEIPNQRIGHPPGGEPEAVGVEQLPILPIRRAERLHAGSGTEVRISSAEINGLKSKAAPFTNRRMRHPKILSQRLAHPPGLGTGVRVAEAKIKSTRSESASFKDRRVRHPKIPTLRLAHPPLGLH